MRLLRLTGSKVCRIRHRFSQWAYVKHDYADGLDPEINRDLQARMCRNCGHEEIRERVCE